MRYAMHDFKFTDLRPGDAEYISEVILPYKGQFDAVPAIEYYKKYNIRIVWDMRLESLSMKDLETLIRELRELTEIYRNMAFRMPFPNETISSRVPGMFLSPDYAARTFQEAMSLYAAGYHEIYVTGSLAANLSELRQLKRFMRIRIIPNLVQTDAFYFGNPAAVDPFKCFWIRPEGAHIYEGAVSVLEFAQDEFHQELGLITIYRSGEWTGKIGDVIIDETKKLDTVVNFYDKNVDKARAICGLECQKSEKCHLCEHIAIQAGLVSRVTEKIEDTEKEPKNQE